jgi:hypothetical protein
LDLFDAKGDDVIGFVLSRPHAICENAWQTKTVG